MSDVKNKVIRIVQGLPPEEPKVLVELASDETVVKSKLVNKVLGPLGEPDPKLIELLESAPSVHTDEPQVDDPRMPEFAQGGEIPAGTLYYVGEQSSGHWSHSTADSGKGQVANAIANGNYTTFVFGESASDPTGYSGPQFMHMEPDSDIKRFIKFKMFDGNRIIPSQQPVSEIEFRFFKADNLPQIVLN